MPVSPPFDSGRSPSAWGAVRRGRPEAAAVIWNWRSRGVDSSAGFAAAARRRGLRQTLIAVGVALLIYLLVAPLMAAVVLVVAGLNLLLALLSPLGGFARVERGVGWFARAVGIGLTWLFLVPLFFLFFVPFRLLLRRAGRDAMKRFYVAGAPSYWRIRTEGDVGPRRRQF